MIPVKETVTALWKQTSKSNSEFVEYYKRPILASITPKIQTGKLDREISDETVFDVKLIRRWRHEYNLENIDPNVFSDEFIFSRIVSATENKPVLSVDKLADDTGIERQKISRIYKYDVFLQWLVVKRSVSVNRFHKQLGVSRKSIYRWTQDYDNDNEIHAYIAGLLRGYYKYRKLKQSNSHTFNNIIN